MNQPIEGLAVNPCKGSRGFRLERDHNNRWKVRINPRSRDGGYQVQKVVEDYGPDHPYRLLKLSADGGMVRSTDFYWSQKDAQLAAHQINAEEERRSQARIDAVKAMDRAIREESTLTEWERAYIHGGMTRDQLNDEILEILRDVKSRIEDVLDCGNDSMDIGEDDLWAIKNIIKIIPKL